MVATTLPNGSELREVRTELGLTIAELAEISGVSRKLISAIERGMDAPYERVHALVYALGQRLGDDRDSSAEEPA